MEIATVSRKDERRITSVLHKANVERQARMQQVQQQQQQLQLQQTLQQNRPTQNGNARKIQPHEKFNHGSNRIDVSLLKKMCQNFAILC